MFRNLWRVSVLVSLAVLSASCADKISEDEVRDVPCEGPNGTTYCNRLELCCQGACVVEDNHHCGIGNNGCGVDCTAGGSVCVNHVCTCNYIDPDTSATTSTPCVNGTCCSTGCTMTSVDPKNCGACGISAPGTRYHVVGSSCDDGKLRLICESGYANCDGDASNGCECSADSDCGNGIVEAGEDCDGEKLNDATCASVVGTGSVGKLSCDPVTCKFNTDACSGAATCGNGQLDGKEVCDHDEFGGKTCESLGFGGGQLRCADNCLGLDRSECTAKSSCGNKNLDVGEVCDGDMLNGATCEDVRGKGSTGTLKCLLNCSDYDASGCSEGVMCGDGVREGDEACDRDDFGSATCETLVGPGSAGTLSCNSRCKISTYNCSPASGCGNGIIGVGEKCDGTNLNGATCESVLGTGSTGKLSCSSNCAEFDVSQCTAPAKCGNGFIEEGEVCDGLKLDDKTCETEVGPNSRGQLSCAANCTSFDKSQCTGSTTCSNGVIDLGELCDGTSVPSDATCEILVGKGSTGVVVCDSECKRYNLSYCSAASKCDNGKIDDGEVCDGKNLNGASCASVVGKGSTGTLKCASTCTGYDTSACSAAEKCGDSIIQDGELCDKSNVSNKTCEDIVGFGSTGTLRCADNCAMYDTSRCSPAKHCGNGKLDEDEVCDGPLVFKTCASAVGAGSIGTVACNDTCSGYITTGCSEPPKCGNGKLDDGETCDDTFLNGMTCATLVGYGSTGRPVCNNTCDGYLNGTCTAAKLCGNGKIDSGEDCDDTKLNGATCASKVGTGSKGSVKCTPDCRYDLSNCSAADGCNNGRLDSGEACDGTNFKDGKKTCAAYDSLYSDGLLACTSACTIDTSACVKRCGNGRKESGEACDTNDFGSSTCASVLGISNASGKLKCTNSCKIDSSDCEYCGDGVLNNEHGSNVEWCDNQDLLYENCKDLNASTYSGGKLSCTSSCEFDTSACTLAPRCGDNTKNNGEMCDGSDFGGITCSSVLNVTATGSLVCENNCTTISDKNCRAVDGCVENTARCRNVDGVDHLDLCDEHGLWVELGACTNGLVCNENVADCVEPLDWCVFYSIGDDGRGYGRALLHAGTDASEVMTYVACTQDLAKPVQEWDTVWSEVNPGCDPQSCGANTEFQSEVLGTNSALNGMAGTVYCTFIVDFDQYGMYACRAQQTGDATPVLLDATTTVDASFVRTFNK